MSVREILEPGKNCWDIGEVNQTGLLIDGCAYYRAFHRAAESAERYILLSGWQFDSDVALLRGKDAAKAGDAVRLLSFLNDLCKRKKRLRVYLLAWNFSVIYSLDREWFQEWYFNWTTHERLTFCFDHCHALGASHHQKFAVFDGTLAFVGGLDLCSGRWDERDHRPDNPNRVNSDQSTYPPFHDIQSYHRGPIAQRLAELFKLRWRIVCGKELELPPRSPNGRIRFKPTVAMNATRVAISRTQAATKYGNQESVQEIRRLFLDAIDAAETLIYIENQYFSSEALYRALVRRMMQSSRPRLEIVMILTKDADALLEQVSIGIAQVKLIRRLKQVASERGHSLGVYYTASAGPDGKELPTYIHSKLFLVDDRFLSVGSANMNNRSMGLDSELNVSWEASPHQRALMQSIRRVRATLLAEHTGATRLAERRALGRTKGLVDHLNRLAECGSSRLRHHSMEAIPEYYQWLTTLLPDGLPFDSEEPIFEENVYEGISDKKDGFFSKGVTSLKNWLQNMSQGLESHKA
ncbi:MAG: phospholipase D-like domain-containing protein [Candidatus Binatia bacterium]